MKARRVRRRILLLAGPSLSVGALIRLGIANEWVQFHEVVWYDNDPLQDPQPVARVESDGTLALGTGERVRCADESADMGAPLLAALALGVSGDLAVDVAQGGGVVDVERLGVDPDGITRARLRVRVENPERWLNGLGGPRITLPVVRLFRPRHVRSRLFRYVGSKC